MNMFSNKNPAMAFILLPHKIRDQISQFRPEPREAEELNDPVSAVRGSP